MICDHHFCRVLRVACVVSISTSNGFWVVFVLLVLHYTVVCTHLYSFTLAHDGETNQRRYCSIHDFGHLWQNQ